MNSKRRQKIREETAHLMKCETCGDPLVVITPGIVCPRGCGGVRYSIGEHTYCAIEAAWPEHRIEHDRPFRTRLKEFSDGIKRLDELDKHD